MKRWSAVVAIVFLSGGCSRKEEPPAAGEAKPAAPLAEADPAASKVTPEEIKVTAASPEALEAFEAGRALIESGRIPEGLEKVRQAVRQDKKFAMALAYLGFFDPGEEGLRMLERASALAEGLSRVERLYIDHLLTWRQGDTATLYEQRKRLLALAPNDWRVHYEVGVAAGQERNWAQAEQSLRTATLLNPDGAAAYSELGYALMNQGKFPEAIRALEQYAAKNPQQPTALDALGEAQLRAGQLSQAELSFRKAATAAGDYWRAWLGVATASFLRSDWASGREALQKAKDTAGRAEDKLEAQEFLIWSLLANQEPKLALEAVSEYEKEARAAEVSSRWAEAPVLRAAIHAESGSPQRVFHEVATSLDRGRKAQLYGDPLAQLYREAFIWKTLAESRLKKEKDIQKSFAFITKTASISPGAESQSAKSFASALVALTKGEKQAAIRQFMECIPEDYLCRLELLKLRFATADPAAEQDRAQLLAGNRRDPLYLYVRAVAQRLQPSP